MLDLVEEREIIDGVGWYLGLMAGRYQVMGTEAGTRV